MEDHPAEALENNFYGTRSIADAADAVGCERFVMISTDKAVNPSSVMGASKRLAELYIRHLDAGSATHFCMVRFGNVLGSACSLIPIWADQLAQGGPITVTHPEMTRYFMTIPEAAGLVIQAGAYAGRHGGEGPGGGGEVFLLDMGSPIRILDMADRFLRLQGFAPDVDVQIQITGPRPGEKLFEELAYHGEDMLPTPHPSIRRWRTAPSEPAQMQQLLATFDRLRDRGGRPWNQTPPDAVVRALRSALPEMVTAAAG
jgi:FlaA1/EpsC-like NDP-sugar epimerase